MARRLQFMDAKRCIDCGVRHNRCGVSWRCWTCNEKVLKYRIEFSKFLRRAMSNGIVQPVKSLLCVDCGSQAEHWDHRDYRRLEEIQPVCRTCNFRRGPAAWRNYSEALTTSAVAA